MPLRSRERRVTILGARSKATTVQAPHDIHNGLDTSVPLIILPALVQYKVSRPVCWGSLTSPGAIHDFVFVEGEVVVGEEII